MNRLGIPSEAATINCDREPCDTARFGLLLENRRGQLRRPQTEPRDLAYRVLPGVVSDDLAVQAVQVDQFADLKAIARRSGRRNSHAAASSSMIGAKNGTCGELSRSIQIFPLLGRSRDGGTEPRDASRGRRRGLEHLADDAPLTVDRESREHRQRQNLGGGPLCDRKITWMTEQSVVRLGEVERNRVMDAGVDARRRQLLLRRAPDRSFAPHRGDRPAATRRDGAEGPRGRRCRRRAPGTPLHVPAAARSTRTDDEASRAGTPA